MLTFLVLLLACAADTKDDTASPVDSAEAEDTPDTADTSGSDTSGSDTSDTTTDTADTSGGGDTGDSGVFPGFDLATCDGGHEDPTPQAPECANAGGICVASGNCSTGTHLEALDGDCAFDDGPGNCCVPPEPAATGDSCADMGGVCSPIAGCGMVDGWFANATDCTGVNNICCVTEDSCPGQEDITCCSRDERGVPTTQFDAACDRGTLECPFEGVTLDCIEDCPV